MDDRLDRTEEKILEDIRRSAEDVEVPEGLKPENIQGRLKIRDPKKKWRRYCMRMAETAAVLLLAFAVYSQTPDMERQKAVQETESAERYAVQESALAEEAAAPEAAEGTAAEGTAAEEETLAPVGTSAALFQKLWDYRNIQTVSGALFGAKGGAYTNQIMSEEAEIAPMYETAEDMDAGSYSATVAAEDAADFSQTNLREAGVDEGDVVKTDGKYLYVMRNNSEVEIIRIDGAQMEQVSSVEPQKLQESIRDMYLDGERLILVMTAIESGMHETREDVYEVQERAYTKVCTYDISDREDPRLTGSAEQEGYYRGSRKSGDYVYLFTEFEPQLENTEEDSRIMPLAGGEEVSAEKIYVPEIMENSSYLVISSVDSKNPSVVADSAAVVSGADNFYVSAESIFICNEQWSGYDEWVTEIMKFSYEDGRITGVAAGQVDGYLNDTFSLDEYQGYLRLVVTGWSDGEEINSLYVLDGQLDIVGEIADIAKGETIRSARFMGETGYFVTFRQTDPLFSVDLSDPEDPKLLGELKISGFSSYLHFYGENQLLGIGYEADEDTGITTGLKLSMFDISDPSDVSEQKKYVIEDASYCPGLWDYKAILIDPQKNLFGLVCDGQYLVFSYNGEDGFVNELAYKLDQEEGASWYTHDDDRGLFAGNTFYLVKEEEVLAFDMENAFELAGRLEL